MLGSHARAQVPSDFARRVAITRKDYSTALGERPQLLARFVGIRADAHEQHVLQADFPIERADIADSAPCRVTPARNEQQRRGRPFPVIGKLDRIAAHERELVRYAMDRLQEVPGLTVHGPNENFGPTTKVGVLPFTIAGIDHGLIAAVLGYEHGVGVRSGCFCAHPYIAHLLRISRFDSKVWVEQATHGDKRGGPGMVRISFGCYNTMHDVDIVTRGLEQVVAGEFAADYRADVDGSFHPVGYVEPLLFSLDAR